ncbi:MAG: acyl carrier protein [Bryobacteraceae bacterium]
MNGTLAQIQDIFRDVLDNPSVVLTRESNVSTVPGWDSMTHINLIYNIEQEFSVRFGLAELQELKNVGDLLDQKLAQSQS